MEVKTTFVQPPAPFFSTEVLPDRRITFRLAAPQASDVRLSAGDIPGLPQGGRMSKGENGIWEITVPPVPPGAYRYNFNVGGVTTIDPRNPATSESLGNTWSLVVVPGAERMDTKNVPHGAVAAVTYYSTALSRFRRMHVYTPPGYERGKGNYPVFYLLHGAGDCDASWSTVGRAGFILDNLIAEGKAKPMIVVMPAGHTRAMGAPGGGGSATDEFVADFTKDVMPHIEKHYRTIPNRQNRAIAGLSMGGMQTLNVAIPRLEQFGYIGVYSSGLFGIVPRQRPGEQPPVPTNAPFPWEVQNKAVLENPMLKKGLRLFWLGIGREDFLYSTHTATVALFKKYGFPVTNHETEGGHTWLVWRDYLIEFAQKLFR